MLGGTDCIGGEMAFERDADCGQLRCPLTRSPGRLASLSDYRPEPVLDRKRRESIRRMCQLCGAADILGDSQTTQGSSAPNSAWR